MTDSSGDARRAMRSIEQAYLIGVDERASTAYIVSIHGNLRGGISSIPTTWPLNCANLRTLRDEVRDYWRTLAATSIGVLQEFVRGGEDGWELALRELKEAPERFLGRLRRLGEVSGRMHSVLGSDPADPNFAPEEPSNEALGLLTATVDEQIEMSIPYAVSTHVKTTVALDDGGGRAPCDWDRVFAMFSNHGFRGYMGLEYEAAEDPAVAVPRHLRRLKELALKYSAWARASEYQGQSPKSPNSSQSFAA